MDLLERAREHPWYHVLELSPELTTSGMFDLRPYVDAYGLPDRMEGMRVLEVGTWDGFWAFEMERRGAQVTAIDVDDERDLDIPPRRRPREWPTVRRGDGFRLAREILGSSVERIECSVYDAKPEDFGTFDVVFCGSVIMHLRDQMLALERIAELCDGLFISAEEYDRAAGLMPLPMARYLADRDKAVVYWLPSIKTWRRMMWTAGFDDVRRHNRFKMRSRLGFAVPHVVHHARKAAA